MNKANARLRLEEVGIVSIIRPHKYLLWRNSIMVVAQQVQSLGKEIIVKLLML